MDENRQHISLREGEAYLDGIKILDLVSLSVDFVPTVATSTTVGNRGTNRRWINHDIQGSFSEYKSTPWLKEKVEEYLATGKTPEMTITGISNDKNSDYYETYKKTDSITISGAVLTGNISLLSLDTGGEFVQHTVNFGAKSYK